jgi:hypothetical protein
MPYRVLPPFGGIAPIFCAEIVQFLGREAAQKRLAVDLLTHRLIGKAKKEWWP